MKISAGCLTMSPQQRRPVATNLSAEHKMFYVRHSSNGTRLASRTNTQMTSEAKATRLYYKDFAEASQPLPNADRQGG